MKLRQIIGEKVNMTQMPDRHGRMQAVTLVRVTPNVVVKELDLPTGSHGKKALIAAGSKNKVRSSLAGVLKGIKDIKPRILKELVVGNEDLKKGDKVGIGDVFRKGDLVDVVGTSKGKGFAGGMKRHGFHGGPKTHGQSDRHRAPGSIGSGTTPGRVIKGLRMAGHMGVERVTVQGLEILNIDADNNLVAVKGAVPGPSKGILILSKSIKKKKAYHEPDAPVIPNLGGDDEEKTEVSEGTSETAVEAAQEAPQASDAQETGESNG